MHRQEVLRTILEQFLASEDFQTGIISSTTDWGGRGYSVELFLDGTWRVLWNNQIGNLYETPGKILGLPRLNTDDMTKYVNGGTGNEDDFLREAFECELEELKASMRSQLSNTFVVDL